ncbi:Uncharacterized protein Rs2_30550 [Raphanus sativus]|nr:Uncharacterized protein Rs2_30550 [Raphanus sativus]
MTTINSHTQIRRQPNPTTVHGSRSASLLTPRHHLSSPFFLRRRHLRSLHDAQLRSISPAAPLPSALYVLPPLLRLPSPSRKPPINLSGSSSSVCASASISTAAPLSESLADAAGERDVRDQNTGGDEKRKNGRRLYRKKSETN